MQQRYPKGSGSQPRDDDAATDEPASGFARASAPPHSVKRRRVLKIAGAAAAAGVLGAAGYVGYDQVQRHARTGKGIRDRRVKLPGSTPKMVIARGKSPVANVQAALARMGGMKAFVKAGEVVVVKPNIGWVRTPMQAGNTNPEVVAEIVRACIAAGAKQVIVTDCPVQNEDKCFKRSEIESAATKAGAKVIQPSDSSYEVITLSDALGAWDVLEPFVSADKIINVPIVKHHGSAGVTAGMKNWIGITDKRRSSFHANLNQSIAELAALMRPTLTVLDATRVLLRNGPRGGNLADVKRVDAIAMSVDPVAADAWATDILNFPKSKISYLRLAEKMKLGKIDYKKLNPPEITTG